MTRLGLNILCASALIAAPGHAPFGAGSSDEGPGAALAVSIAADSIITPEMIALGDAIFHGKAAGGLCFSCHGLDAKGVRGLAPNLTDGTWLHGDGSYAFIISTVERGVPKPKEAIAPMLPKGGARLSVDQVRAVAAYVYSVSHVR
jgi:mono/diheme cytochrome c family protein